MKTIHETFQKQSQAYALFMSDAIHSDSTIRLNTTFTPINQESILTSDKVAIRKACRDYQNKIDSEEVKRYKAFIVRTIYAYLYWEFLEDLDNSGPVPDYLMLGLIPEEDVVIQNLSPEEKNHLFNICDYIERELDLNHHETTLSRRDWVAYTAHYFFLEFTIEGYNWLMTRYTQYLAANSGSEVDQSVLVDYNGNSFWDPNLTDQEIKTIVSDPDKSLFTYNQFIDYRMAMLEEEEKKSPSFDKQQPKLNEQGEAIDDKASEDIYDEAFKFGSMKNEFDRIPMSTLYGTMAIKGDIELSDKYISQIYRVFGLEGNISNEEFKAIRSLPIYKDGEPIHIQLTMESPFTVLFAISWIPGKFSDQIEERILDPLIDFMQEYDIVHAYMDVSGLVVEPADTNPTKNNLPAIRAFEAIVKLDPEKPKKLNVEAFLGNNLESYRFGVSKALINWMRVTNLSYDEMEEVFKEWSAKDAK